MKTKILSTLVIMLFTSVLMFGQGNDFGWHVNPDSLQLKTVSGIVMVDSVSEMHKIYSVNSFRLFQNYPNPFNPSTDIRFELKDNVHVTLSVYNIIGQKVAELVNSEMLAGVHIVLFNGSRLSSGIYFYELKAGSYTSVKKMELLK